MLGKTSKKKQNNVFKSISKKKNNSASQYASNSASKTFSRTSEIKISVVEAKDVNVTKIPVLQDGSGTSNLKISKTLPALVAEFTVDEHPLDYSSEAVLVEEEDVPHEKREISDSDHEVDTPHLSNTRKEFNSNAYDQELDITDTRHNISESKVETLEDVVVLDELDIIAGSSSDDHIQIPKRYQEGTAGGRLFKEQTLAEIDGYLYLGKVSLSTTYNSASDFF